MLVSSLDMSSNTSFIGFWLFWCSCAFRFYDVPGRLRSASIKVSGLPLLRHCLLIRLSPVAVWIVLLKRALCLLLSSKKVIAQVILESLELVQDTIDLKLKFIGKRKTAL
ncbi:hypothetical protein QL285_082003 [Trifolium repens]|nr:hypothetical protein QL285_082003 [Trifolium repens]